VALHAHGQRFDAAQSHQASNGPGTPPPRSGRSDGLAAARGGRCGAANEHRNVAQIFGGVVDDNISAELKRLLQVRRCKRVVHREDGPAFDLARNGGDVHNLQERLVGVSTQTSLVAGVMIFAKPAGWHPRVGGATSPHGLKTRSSSRRYAHRDRRPRDFIARLEDGEDRGSLPPNPDANASPRSPLQCGEEDSRAVASRMPLREYS